MVVDFIPAADAAMRQRFGRGLTDDGVHVLDAGTGTFITHFPHRRTG
jgi:predicted helicase